MPEARDRLSREDDVIAAYSRRRISRTGERNIGRESSIGFVLEDENEERPTVGTTFRWRGTAMVGTPGPVEVAAGRGATGNPRIGRSPQIIGRGNLSPVVRISHHRGRVMAIVGTPGPMGVVARRNAIGTARTGRTAQIVGRENLSPVVGSGRSHGRGRGSALPTWYPRRPLNDITTVMRAIERRGEREPERGGEGLQTESPALQDRMFHDPSVSTSGAHLEHDISMTYPHPTILSRRGPPTIGKVPKILLDITHQNDGDSVCLTPQKRLLNNIDTVEKVVMEELWKLKRTPSAKKAEREKRVRTLMSMR